jgi:hypothetical protein
MFVIRGNREMFSKPAFKTLAAHNCNKNLEFARKGANGVWMQRHLRLDLTAALAQPLRALSRLQALDHAINPMFDANTLNTHVACV